MNLTDDYVLFTDESIDIDFLFKAKEIEKFLSLWNEGEPLSKIAQVMRRKPIELSLLIMDLDLRDSITHRESGIFGGALIDKKK